MTIYYNATGATRKKLVQAIVNATGAESKYHGAPTFSYQIDYFTVTREGNLEFDDRADSEEIENLIETLAQQGFIAEAQEAKEEDNASVYDKPEAMPTGLCVSMPRSLFTDTALANLDALVTVKGSLIKKALGVDKLPIEVTEHKVSFPWFVSDFSPEEVKAYNEFICKLCEMARTQKRITAKEKKVDNEKYAFRCFLLRLGFIGAEFKTERKILLRNLTGSSAFKGAAKRIGDSHA